MLAVNRQFRAEHALVGGDWGAENLRHGHDYRLELRLEARQLDQHGFIVDIVTVDQTLDQLLARFAGRYLNDLEEFQELNPSLEHFARILAEALNAALVAAPLEALSLQLWESDSAWARCRLER